MKLIGKIPLLIICLLIGISLLGSGYFLGSQSKVSTLVASPSPLAENGVFNTPAPSPMYASGYVEAVSPAPTHIAAPVVKNQPDAVPAPTPVPKGVSLSIDPTNTTATVGQMIPVYLKMDTGSDQVTEAEIHVNYDHNKIELVSVAVGSFLPVTLVPQSHDNNSGLVSITVGSSSGSPASGVGTLATFTFKSRIPGTAFIQYAGNTRISSLNKTGNSLTSSTGATITAN